MNALNEYHYRKTFGLSKAEMLAEPISDYLLNSKISSLLAEKEESEYKKAESVAKKTGKN